MQAHSSQTNHRLTLIALFSLFSFLGTGDQAHQWLWLSCRILGCTAALSAAYGYSKANRLPPQDPRLHDPTHLEQLHTQLTAAHAAHLEELEAERDRLALEGDRIRQAQEAHGPRASAPQCPL